MILSMIVAIGKNREIGHQNKMLWHIKEDFAHFKRTTLGHTLLMGRKTFESIGKPLPGRHTIVLSSKEGEEQDCVSWAKSIDEALDIAKKKQEDELFICGGGEIYKLCLPLCKRLYLSRVEYEGVADSFFPDFSSYQWSVKEERVHEGWSFELLEK